MKKLFIVLALLASSVVPAHAVIEPSIVVIDTGTNTSLFSNNIVAEYCVLEWTLCPNGKTTMEGTGAANLPPTTYVAFDHGAQMMSIVLKVNPNAKIIPIRIVGMNPNGSPTIYTNQAVKLALDWVVLNQERYNIQVVNVSQGAIFAGCKVPAGTTEDVAALKTKGVVVVAASGNASNRTAMDSIACLPDVISVGATDNPDPGSSGKAWDPNAKPYIARYSNGNAQTSYYTNARWYVTNKNGTTKFMVGTSNASAALASLFLTNRNPATTVASNEWLTGKYVFIG
jgi:Subtilase family